jgi:pyridoxine 5-phosphate synthase
MRKKRLGVNIDHIATIRNARGENYPDPLKAALMAEKSGADSITIHLREDRRHIRDYDLKSIKRKLKIPLNLEIAPTKEMLNIAITNKPNFVCIVPEKRREITTEGGLNLKKNVKFIKRMISLLTKKRIRVSLFINPNLSDVLLAFLFGAKCIELHTGSFCNSFNKKNSRLVKSNLSQIKQCARYAKNFGLEVHAGHGLTYESTNLISKIDDISEFNIGHFIVADSVFVGLENSINKFKKIINR